VNGRLPIPLAPCTQIYFFRHGETEWNAAGRFQGLLDSPLMARGVAQAHGIGRRLASLGLVPARFQASPLDRTRHSAAIIGSHLTGPQIDEDARLAEVSLGGWNGLTAIDIDHLYPQQLAGTTRYDWYFRSPDGESYDRALERAETWLRDARGIVLAVSHGLFSRFLCGAYLCLLRDAALTLPVPQDVIWRLADGVVERVEVDAER
jgi:probable phosphoglycerate mutase